MEPTSTRKNVSGVALFVAGAAAVLGAQQIVGPHAEGAPSYQRFQNEQTFVSRLSPDGGMPTYAGRTCGYLFAKDGGQTDTCTENGSELSDVEARAFETYLKALGVKAPR